VTRLNTCTGRDFKIFLTPWAKGQTGNSPVLFYPAVFCYYHDSKFQYVRLIEGQELRDSVDSGRAPDGSVAPGGHTFRPPLRLTLYGQTVHTPSDASAVGNSHLRMPVTMTMLI
jgi:hypothetical protein